MGIFSAAVGGIGSIFGGISASKAMRKAKANVEAQRKKNQDWYDQRYNEDATQRADVQSLLTQATDKVLQRNKAAEGAAAVMGGTDESVAQAKAANNQVITDTLSNVNAQNSARKDQIEQTYMQKDDQYVEQLNQIEQGKAKAINNAIKGVSEASKGIPF